jgi:hypothetical protein
MIVPSTQTPDGIGPDIPEDVADAVTGFERLEDGTYRLTFRADFIPPREAARRAAEQEIARLTALPLLQAETLTDAQIEAIAAAWESWEPGVAYAVGDVVEFGGALWEVRQAHTSQADWEPPDVLALFQRFRGAEDPDVTPEWAPATPYAVDDLVTYGGTTYRCRQAHTSQPGWEPPNVPALWVVA